MHAGGHNGLRNIQALYAMNASPPSRKGSLFSASISGSAKNVIGT